MIVQLLKEMKNYNSKFVIIKYVLSIILIIMIIYKKDYYYSIFMLLEVGIVFGSGSFWIMVQFCSFKASGGSQTVKGAASFVG